MKLNSNDDFLNKQNAEKISNFVIEEENELNNNSNISDNDNKYITSKKNKINKPQVYNNNLEIKEQNNIKINDNIKTIDSNEDEAKKVINLNLFNNSIRGQKEIKREIKSYLINESEHHFNNNNNKKNQDLIRNNFSKNEKPFKLNLRSNTVNP